MSAAATTSTQELTPGLRRAAVTLVSLGKEHAAKVLAHMEPDEVAALSKAVLVVGAIRETEVRSTLVELADSMGQLSNLTAPNAAWLTETLTPALGAERGNAVLADITRPAPFAWTATADPDAFARVLEEEKPGTVAVALAHVSPDLGAALFKRLSKDQQVAVASRVATLDGLTESVIREIDAALFEQVGQAHQAPRVDLDGVEKIVGLLSRSTRSTSDAVLADLAKADPAMAAKVKEALFTFDDVLGLDSRAVQRVLNDVNMRTLAVAIFGATQQTIDAVFANLPERKSVILREEVADATTVRPADVRAARTEVVTKALEMEAAGTIVIDFGADDEDA